MLVGMVHMKLFFDSALVAFPLVQHKLYYQIFVPPLNFYHSSPMPRQQFSMCVCVHVCVCVCVCARACVCVRSVVLLLAVEQNI